MPPTPGRILSFSLAASAVAIALAAARPGDPAADDHSWFDPVIDVRALLLDGLVERPDPVAMRDAAIRAMVESVDDPYTVWIPPAEQATFNKSMRGNYVGIGCEIDTDGGYLRVVSPFEESPAERAGIRAGDLIIDIDGTSTHDRPAAECTRLLLGDPGTEVRLTVRHRDGREEALTVTRAPIQARTVKGLVRDESGWRWTLAPGSDLGYVRLLQFTETSSADLRRAVDEAIRLGARGLILDLRFNGGGSLGSAIEIADVFLSGEPVVTVRGRRDGERTFASKAAGDDVKVPLVVLVNDASASASEIVAGALREAGRARVVGTRTYGKGSVQEVRDLPEGRGSLKLTTAKYYLPSGRNLHRDPDAIGKGLVWGVDPDPGYHVSMSPPEANASFELRRRFEVPGVEVDPANPPRPDDPAWIARGGPVEDPASGLGDPQLAAAVTALRAKIDSGEWPARIDGSDEDGLQAAAVDDELLESIAYRERLEREMKTVEERIRDLEKARDEATAAPAGSPVTP
jgi:carboxyl-terminal processing protease